MTISLTPVVAQEDVTLHIMNYSAEQQEFYDTTVQEFTAETGINVQWETLSRDAYEETLPRMFDDGSAPDIFFWLGANRVLTVSELIEASWIQPLDQSVLPDDWTGFAAGTSMSIIPVLLVFFLFQGYFVRGLQGAVKQ